MIIVLTIIITFSFIAYRSFIQKIISEKNNQHQLELLHQKEISEQYAIIQETERKRIAEMLHDDVGNKLNVLSLWLTNKDTWNNERSKEIITNQIPELIEAARTISHALYPVGLEQFGLIITLEELISNVSESLTIQLLFNHKYQQKQLSVEVHIYRITQEFLSNVIKHSHASEMIIHLRDAAKSLSVILADNGIGFEQNEFQKGMGLKNIESRLQSINAFYKWKSRKQKGSRLIIILLKG